MGDLELSNAPVRMAISPLRTSLTRLAGHHLGPHGRRHRPDRRPLPHPLPALRAPPLGRPDAPRRHRCARRLRCRPGTVCPRRARADRRPGPGPQADRRAGHRGPPLAGHFFAARLDQPVGRQVHLPALLPPAVQRVGPVPPRVVGRDDLCRHHLLGACRRRADGLWAHEPDLEHGRCACYLPFFTSLS